MTSWHHFPSLPLPLSLPHLLQQPQVPHPKELLILIEEVSQRKLEFLHQSLPSHPLLALLSMEWMISLAI
jgi:hypothetical protein